MMKAETPWAGTNIYKSWDSAWDAIESDRRGLNTGDKPMATTNQLNAGFDALKADLFEEISEAPFWAQSSVKGFLTDEKILRATRRVAAAIEKAAPVAPVAPAKA